MISLDVPSTCQIENLEDIYKNVFEDIYRGGVFVEVGAYDGITYSNTWPLACIGWNGLCIEPVKAFFDRCVGNHKDHNVRVINKLVGLSMMYTMCTDGHELYTVDPTLAAALGAHIYCGEIQGYTLDSILEEWDVLPNFELLVIDVEGIELDVLKGFSLKYYNPRMVIIETHSNHENIRLRLSAGWIDKTFVDAGYMRIYNDTINSIYTSPRVQQV